MLDWTADHAAAFGHESFTGEHHFGESGLFNDDALIAAFNAHARHDLQIAMMGCDPTRMDQWVYGTVGDADGEALLEAIRRGRLWLNMLHLDQNPVYRSLIDQSVKKTGLNIVHRRVMGLVSSPGAQVLYHLDPELVMLFHIRGHKRLYLYPADDPAFADPKDVERIFTGESHEDIPFQKEWDQAATVYDLSPGAFATWPQNAPHRVENGSDLNVSLSMSFYTPEAIFKERLYCANRYFRRFLPFSFESWNVNGWNAKAKVLAYRLAQKMKIRQFEGVKDTPKFEIDPFSPDGIRMITG